MAAKLTIKNREESPVLEETGLAARSTGGSTKTLVFHVKHGEVRKGPPMPETTAMPPSNDSRPDWDSWAMSVAHVVAIRADCTRRQVGAVILDTNNHIVATGYNGAPSGEPGCKSMGACPRGQLSYDQIAAGANYSGNCTAVHAEDNAVRQAKSRGVDLSTCRIYVTDQPCYGCKEVIRSSGLAAAFIANREWDGKPETPRILPADLTPETPSK